MEVKTIAPQYRGIPELDIDKLMAERHGHTLDGRQRRERRIAWNLIRHLQANGWRVFKTWDGEEATPVSSAKDAMESIFNLDEVWVYFTNLPEGEKTRIASPTSHGVYLVLGNDTDIVSDWGYADGDADGFDKVMEAFDAERFA